MLLVDRKVGSRELLTQLHALGAPAQIASDELATDFQWVGNGEEHSILIGAELKTVSDLCTSMRSHRLEGQQTYPMMVTYDVRYLIVEGIWRRQKETGLVEVIRGNGWGALEGRYLYSEVDAFLA